MSKFKVGFGLLAPPIILSLLALVGWAFDIPPLRSGFVSGVAMNPATAVCFILLSLEAGRLIAENNSPVISRVGKWIAWVVVVASAMKLSDIALGTSFDIDTQLFQTKLDENPAQPNRMAPNTAACFLALGVSLLFLRGGSNSILLAQGLATSVLLDAIIAFIGYLYDLSIFYRVGNFIPMALNTAVSFIAIAGAVLYVYPHKGFLGFLSDAVIGSRATRPLHIKILLWFLAISIPSLVITAFFNYQYSKTALQDEEHDELRGIADSQVQFIDRFVAERKADISVFAEFPSIKTAFQKIQEAFFKGGADSAAYLEMEKEFRPLAGKILSGYDYKNVYLVSPVGDVFFSAMPEHLFKTNVFTGIAKNSELSRLVKTALETKTHGISGVAYYPELKDKVTMYLAAPIVQGENVLGVLVLRMSSDNIFQYIKSTYGLGKTGESALGTLIGDEVVFVAPTRFDPEAAFKYRVKTGSGIALPMTYAVQGQNGEGYSMDYRGQPVWAVWRYLPSLNLGMVVKMDISEINAMTAPIQRFSGFMTLFVFLLSVGVAFCVSKSIAKPIERLMVATKAIAAGQLEQRVEVGEKNEIGMLADSFNQMAAHLENSYAKIAAVVTNAMDGIITIHDDGRIESFNPAAEKIFGYTADELVGKNINLLMPEPYRTEHDGYLKNYLRTGQSKILGVAREVPALRKNGETFFLEISVNEMFLENQRLFSGIVRDITERVRAEQKLKLKDSVLDAIANAVIVTDISARIEWANPAFCKLTGFNMDEVIGRRPKELIKSGKHDSAYFEKMWQTILSGKIWHGEITNRRKNGDLYQDEMTITPLANAQGDIAHFIAVKGDISKRKHEEEELRSYRERLETLVEERTGELKRTHVQLLHSEKLSALGKLTGSIAHEFNNPLYGVKNVLEQTLESSIPNEKNKRLLELAVKECNRMADLIRQLREFYRPSEGVKTLVDINQIVDDILTLNRKKMLASKILVEKQFAPGLAKINAVEDQLKQVFLNLIQNAEDAIGDGGGKIMVATENSASTVKIRIKDNGGGIKPEHIKTIFEPFFTTKSAVNGTGLGLPVSYGIVKAHGGDIEVESRVGDGTVFTVILPIATDG